MNCFRQKMILDCASRHVDVKYKTITAKKSSADFQGAKQAYLAALMGSQSGAFALAN